METVLDKLHEPWSPATERVPASHPRNRISSIRSDAIQQNHFTHTLLPGHKKAGVAKSLRHSGIGFVFIKNSGISAMSYDSKLFHIYSIHHRSPYRVIKDVVLFPFIYKTFHIVQLYAAKCNVAQQTASV